MRIFVALIVWAAAIAGAAGLSASVAGSIHNTPTSTSSSSGSSSQTFSSSSSSFDASNVKATDSDSLFQAANFTKVLALATQRYGADAKVDNLALYPGYLSLEVIVNGNEIDYYVDARGSQNTDTLGTGGADGTKLFKLSQVKATAPAVLASRIAAFGHVSESDLHYMVADADPINGHFEWLVYPVSGSGGAEYFRAASAHSSIVAETDKGPQQLPG